MIEIDKVSKWFSEVQVRADCSTQMARGDVVVVRGPSCSGKSPLINTVNGLEPVQQGAIRVDGVTVTDRKTDLPQLRAKFPAQLPGGQQRVASHRRWRWTRSRCCSTNRPPRSTRK